MMQSDTEPKFCKDCKHYSPADAAIVFGVGMSCPSMCFHPKNISEPELVRGSRHPLADPADLRKPEGNCGPDGAMFEAKPQEPPPPVLASRLLEITEKQRRGLWDLFRF